jgi:HTH-type transcriptional regulator, sugar sensing transcriptional regulator
MNQPTRGRRGNLEGIDPVVGEGLAFLGLTAYEIRVYSAILQHPHSRVPEIARQSKVPQPKVYSTVKRLLERGLVETHLGPVNEYSAFQPADGFLQLIEESKLRQTEASRAIELLQRRHEEASEGLTQREGRVKLFQSRPAAARAFRELVQRARREVKVIVRFPLVTADYMDPIQQIVDDGGRAQLLCEVEGPLTDEHRDFVQMSGATGAELRRVTKVPTRMAVFDKKIVAMPMSDPVPHHGDGFMMLEVRNGELAESFAKIYDLLWKQGRKF